MSINEQVYGSRDNWIVPNQRTEQGALLTADVYYYDDVADNDNLKIKIANYNTLATPITRMRSQIVGSPQATGDFAVNNNWDVTTSEGIDKTICQFGIGGQSGLANQEYWYTYYDTNVTTLLIADNKDIINVAFGLKNHYRPHVYTNRVYLSPLVAYDNGYAYEQGVIQQVWGKHSTFSVDESSTYGYLPFSGYADAGLITQIPIKNLKISPVIIAYDSNFVPKTFESIAGFLAERQTYNKLCCIKIKFRYAQSTINNFNGEILIDPFFVDDFIGLNGLWGGNNEPYEWSDSKMHWFFRNSDTDGFIVAGRPPYNYNNQYNSIPWYDIYYSTTWAHDSAIGGIVYQTPDFRFALDDNNCFTCDVSSMTDDQITEGIRKQLASFGLFFVDGASDLNLALDDEKTFLGILKNGVGYGDYSNGAKNRDQDQWNWNTMEENNYDPDTPPEPPDPNIYDTASQLNTPSRCSSGTKYYVLNAAGIENLVGELWKAQESIPSDTSYMDFNNEQYLSNNPIDMIVSCKRFPLIPLKASESEALVLGQYETNVRGYELSDTTTWINLGSKLIYKHFKNYLDYQTKITLYIPFCGMINLDPSVWMGQTVNVYMAVDYITGSCTAYLIRDSDKVIYATAEGNCSVDLPVTGLQAATIESQLLRTRSSLDSSKLMMGAKILGGVTAFAIAATTGGAGSVAAPAVIGGVTTIASTISDAYKINQLNYDLHHTEAPVQQIGSSSPLNAWSGELECRLYVYYPAVDPNVNDDAYAHSIGNATVQQGTIDSFGSAGEYAVITNADLSDINCTDSEKTMISSALTSGIYL